MDRFMPILSKKIENLARIGSGDFHETEEVKFIDFGSASAPPFRTAADAVPRIAFRSMEYLKYAPFFQIYSCNFCKSAYNETESLHSMLKVYLASEYRPGN